MEKSNFLVNEEHIVFAQQLIENNMVAIYIASLLNSSTNETKDELVVRKKRLKELRGALHAINWDDKWQYLKQIENSIETIKEEINRYVNI